MRFGAPLPVGDAPAGAPGAGEESFTGVSGSSDSGSESVGVGNGVNSTGGRTGLCFATGLEAGISMGPGLGDRSDGESDETTETDELAGGAMGA